jgi:hypothetical protein
VSGDAWFANEPFHFVTIKQDYALVHLVAVDVAGIGPSKQSLRWNAHYRRQRTRFCEGRQIYGARHLVALDRTVIGNRNGYHVVHLLSCRVNCTNWIDTVYRRTWRQWPVWFA